MEQHSLSENPYSSPAAGSTDQVTGAVWKDERVTVEFERVHQSVGTAFPAMVGRRTSRRVGRLLSPCPRRCRHVGPSETGLRGCRGDRTISGMDSPARAGERRLNDGVGVPRYVKRVPPRTGSASSLPERRKAATHGAMCRGLWILKTSFGLLIGSSCRSSRRPPPEGRCDVRNPRPFDQN